MTPELSVSGQIMPSDLAALANQGIKSIICNRPDFEGSGQPTFSEIKSAAEKLGMEARHIPIGFGGLPQNLIEEFKLAVEEMPNPTHAFCLSGARSSMMVSRSQPRQSGGGVRNLMSMFTGR